MWAKVTDTKIRDRKILHAARLLGGRYGHARVVAVWLEGTLYSNAHQTDGVIEFAVARRFIVDPRPCDVLEVMSDPVDATLPGLIRTIEFGYYLVDHLHDQPSAETWQAEQASRKARRTMARELTHGGAVESTTCRRESTTSIDRPGPASAPLPADRLLGVATVAAHQVLDQIALGAVAPLDAKETLKRLLKKARIPFDATLINDALDRAERGRPMGRAVRSA